MYYSGRNSLQFVYLDLICSYMRIKYYMNYNIHYNMNYNIYGGSRQQHIFSGVGGRVNNRSLFQLIQIHKKSYNSCFITFVLF